MVLPALKSNNQIGIEIEKEIARNEDYKLYYKESIQHAIAPGNVYTYFFFKDRCYKALCFNWSEFSPLVASALCHFVTFSFRYRSVLRIDAYFRDF